MPSLLLSSTTSLCTTCLRSLPAEVWEHEGHVELRKTCDAHGIQVARIADSAEWYRDTLAAPAALRTPQSSTPIAQGCPFDCGTCAQHQQQIQLTIVPITSGCNLSCPICYTHNRNDGAYHMEPDSLAQIVDVLAARDPDKKIINLTGGEPTVHPAHLDLIALCHERGIKRVTLSTHGLGLPDSTLARLAELGTRVVLSFDSFKDATNASMLGGAFTRGKLDIVDRLEVFGIPTTLLPVIAKGVNDHEIGAFIQLALSRPHIRSVELHTMTFTGQYGRHFDGRGRIPPDAVLVAIEDQTDGLLTVADFVPAPAAHPLCYQVAYLIQIGPESWVPLTRFVSRSDLRGLLAGSLYLEPSPAAEAILHRVMTDAWANGADPLLLDALKAFVDASFHSGSPQQRLQAAERHIKAVYIHSHMDEASFDTDRIQQCCVGITAPDGSNIPSCAYNVLYRNRDPRFTAHPAPSIATLGPGRLP